MNFELVLLSLYLHLVFSQYYDDTQEERRLGGNRRRPCVFRTKRKKGHNEGRTFLDWNFQHYDVSYNYNYNIDCSGSSGGGGNYQPGLLGSHFQGDTSNQQGLLGSHFQGGSNNRPGLLGSHLGSHNQGGGLLGSLFNRPQGGLINNIPGIPQIGNVISQTQSQSQAGFFPQGIFSSFGNFFNRPPSQTSSSSGYPPPTQNVPQVTTPTDPDDIIYNDETATPVNTNYDPVPDAYNSGGGRPGRPRPGIYYNQNSYYNKLSQYSINRGY